MLFERVSLSFWRILTWVLLFAALWLFELPELFGQFVSIATLFIFITGLLYLIKKDAHSFRIPSLRAIDRRIEKDSDVRDRPISGLKDTLANDEKRGARFLWTMSRSRLLGLLAKLRPARLRESIAPHDPYALRLGVFMAFLLGLVAAGPEWSLRIKDGLTPFSFNISKSKPVDRFTIMIEAPEYTDISQIILNDKTIQGESVSIAEGSTIKALVNGGFGKPKLQIGASEFEFKDAYEGSVSNEDGELIFKQGIQTLAKWPYTIKRDTPPELEILEESPTVLDDGTMSFDLSVLDDYGVHYIDASFDTDDFISPDHIGVPISVRRSVMSPDGETFSLSPIYDLTSHPWAGLPVKVTFVASDEKGQKSEEKLLDIVLPERSFKHPVAKTLVAIRKELMWEPLDPAIYKKVAYDMHVLSTAKDLIHNDVVVYLALRTGALRLSLNEPDLETTKAIVSLMWDTALRVEDGDLSLAARHLRDAQAALEEALQNPNISEEEIASLMQDFRQAMAEYLTELGREMQKRMAQGQQIPMGNIDAMNTMNQDALADFLEQMEEAMRKGDMSSAQEMLSQMQRLMDMLNPSMQAQIPQDMQMMQEGINELKKLIERQEALLEQTRKQVGLMDMLRELGINNPMNKPQNDNQKSAPFVNTEANRTEQEALRFVLGQLMMEVDDKIGKIPEAMGLSELEMRYSAEKLGMNWPTQSVPHQESAIEYLKQSQDEMMQQLQQRMVQTTGFMLSFGGQSRHDPLGRPIGDQDGSNGDPYGSRVQIPDEAERRRVQEILKLLRRRSGDPSRPREEIDYYRRLLRRF